MTTSTKYEMNFRLHHEFCKSDLLSFVDLTPISMEPNIICIKPNAKFSLCTVKKPHSPVSVHVFPGHRKDLLADIDIHDIKEFNSNQPAYISLVPKELELNDDNVFDSKFEQQPPMQEAAKVVAIVIGNETIAPIFALYLNFSVVVE